MSACKDLEMLLITSRLGASYSCQLSVSGFFGCKSLPLLMKFAVFALLRSRLVLEHEKPNTREPVLDYIHHQY